MRIRSIKPEFWISESVGRLSRDARLLFIGLWSFADDSGRSRGALPAISGALFPYDGDAPKRLPAWIEELEREGMIRRYKGEDGNTYMDIPNWLKHQKIEKPSKSRFPAFAEGSPNTPRSLTEGSPLEQGTGSREQGAMEQGNEGAGKPAPVPAATKWIESARPILHLLNELSGRKFRECETSLNPIVERLKEPEVTVEGAMLMVRRQVALWKDDPKMAEFLRPETLFRKSNFNSYYASRELSATPTGRNSSSHGPNGNPRNHGIAGLDEWERERQARAVNDGQDGPPA